MRNISRRVDLTALVENFRVLNALSTPARCAAVVKADGYGLGMIDVSLALHQSGCDEFFVATVEEGELLRQRLASIKIFVLNGLSGEPVGRFYDSRLTPVINSLDDALRWSSASQTQNEGCALHVDTGMQRLGLSAEEFAKIATNLDLLARLKPVLVMSHLVSAELGPCEINQLQLTRFTKIVSALPGEMNELEFSLANSSGLFLGKPFHYDLCRAGAACYGINPQPTEINPMRPVVEISAPVIQIREITQASQVGYGGTGRVRAGSRLATIAAGYADGYPRHASNRANVQIGEWLAPVIGTVSMDLISVDISHLPSAAVAVGHSAYLVGPMVSLDDLATAAGTIGYEILTNLGRLAKPEYC